MFTQTRSKRILFIGGNYYPELTGVGKYNGEMVDLLTDQGYHCTVVTSYPYYPYWKVQEPYRKCSYWFKKEMRIIMSNLNNPIEIYRCPQYVPHNPTALKRVFLDCTFSFFSLLKVLQLLLSKKKYDYVITVAPSFQIGLFGILFKKVRGCKFIYHIQDLQIDAACELQMIKSKTAIKILLSIEKYILREADVVSSISTGMLKKIKSKCNRDVVLFPNWVDTKSFYPMSEKVNLKEEFNLSPSDKVILYSGAIGEKQGLESILYTADAFQHLTDLKFVICGSGPYKERLKLMAESMNLTNVIFIPLQPCEKLNHLLNLADAHLVLQKANTSDLVMPSKLTTILSVGGLAIVSGSPNSTLYELVSSNKIGIVVNPDIKNSLKEAIENILQSNNDKIQSNARKYAVDFLSTEKIFSRYMQYMQ